MSVRGCGTVVGVECAKLLSQINVRILLIACVASPFMFAAAMRVQSNVPADTLFGRGIAESGFALPLVVLGFAALWIFPAVASLVGGDLFAAEDRYGTWPTVLTRSRSRTELFAGKVVTAFAFSALAVTALAVSSVAAGMIVIGSQPLINLSGLLLSPARALTDVSLAWASVLPPTLGFTALAVLASVATRSSAAGIGLPVVAGLTMQLLALVDGPEALRRVLITSGFVAWHGLLTDPVSWGPVVHGAIVTGLYTVVCLGIAYLRLQRRDIGG